MISRYIINHNKITVGWIVMINYVSRNENNINIRYTPIWGAYLINIKYLFFLLLIMDLEIQII